MSFIRPIILLLAIFALMHPASAKEHCNSEDGTRMSGPANAPFIVQFRLKGKKLPLNVPFDADVTICSSTEAQLARIAVDATMPAHKHGMNYEPEVAQIDGNRYQVKNLVFHMPGIWRLEVIVYAGGQSYQFSHDVSLQ